MKKFISVFLAVLMILCSVSVLASAAEKEEVTPLIIVPGYSASELYLDYGTENEEHIWGVQTKPIIEQVVKNLAKLGISIAELAKGDKDMLIKTVGDAVRELYGVLAMKDDGTSKYNVTAGLTDPAITTTKYVVDTYGEDSGYLHLPEINLYFASIIGAENVFNCHIDFRQGLIQCAKDLDTYVQSVKQYTGASKVRLYGLSHGGGTVGTFLSLIANYPELVETTADEIDSAVMFHPALAGAAFLNDFMECKIKIDEGVITEYAQVGAFSETELEFIMKMIDIGLLDELANALIDEIFDDIVGNWGSIWDFTSPDCYERYKSERLDPVENAKLIEASDMAHYEIMPNYTNAFKKMQSDGVKVSIISGYGRAVVTGNEINSDGILACKSTSGAMCAPIGERFADGYKQSGSICANPNHNHVSPSMEIDASYSYLPENTWFVRRQLHGQVWWDDYTKVLCGKLLFEDDIADVYSDPAYPQFEYSQNPKDEIHVAFDNAATPGQLSQQSKGLYITNLSKKYSVKVSSIYTQGINLRFNTTKLKTIAPGETAYIEFSGEIPDYNMVRDSLVVSYIQVGSLSAAGLKNFPITIVGGSDVEYDESNPYSNVDMVDPFDNVIKGSKYEDILTITGLKSYLSNIFNTLMKFFASVMTKVENFFKK
ncbi:MAG: hypothetical protein NC122_04305 [Faecalibacterium sp.]|nr:hypothetical protein [Ruminococcus sp.]MCM1392877.1 hypothetical protein [Ruminococcus sp.]MCM1485406.1 hypothetical protein [Faecalibacterium sp.]